MNDDWFLIRGATDTPALRKLERIRAYPRGWAHGNGDEFSRSVVDSARRVLTIAASLGLSRTDVFPRRDGGLVASVYLSPDVHDFTLHADGSFEWLHERADVEIECSPISLAELEVKLVELARSQLEPQSVIEVAGIRGRSAGSWISVESYQLARDLQPALMGVAGWNWYASLCQMITTQIPAGSKAQPLPNPAVIGQSLVSIGNVLLPRLAGPVST